MRRLALALFLLLAVSCEATVPEGRFECAADEDCPDDLVCRVDVGRCFVSLDAGTE